MSNVLENLTLEEISKVRILGESPERQQLPRGTEILLTASELDEKDMGNTVVYENEELGQRLTLQQFFSMFLADATVPTLVESAIDGKPVKMIPATDNAKLRVKDAIIKAGGKMPKSFVIPKEVNEQEIVASTTKAYLENPQQGQVRKSIYEAMKVDTSKEVIPLIAPRYRTGNRSLTDAANWKVAQRTLVSISAVS